MQMSIALSAIVAVRDLSIGETRFWLTMYPE